MARPVDLTIRVKADTGEVAPGMQKLDKQLDTAAKSAKKLDSELADISDHDVSLDINTQAITKARSRIDDLRDDIARMKTIDIDADTREAEQEIAKLRRSIKALGDDAAGRGGGGSLADIGGSAKRGLDEASEGMDNFRDESNQTAKETAASFDGSAESIAEAFQEVAANAFGGFGPAGAAAGLGIALGIGVGLQALNQLAEAANKVTDDAIEMNEAFSDATDEAARVEVLQERWNEVGNAINDVRSVWEIWQSRSTTNMEAFADSARLAGLDVRALNDAFTDPDPQTRLAGLNRVLDQQRKALADVRELQNQGHGEDVTPEEARLWDEKAKAIKGTMKALEEEVKVSEAAAELEKANAEVRGVSIEVYREQIAATEEATAAREADAAAVKAAAEAYDQMVQDIADPVATYDALMTAQTEAEQARAQTVADGTKDSTDSWEDYATGVTVSTQELIDEWNRQAEATKAFETNLATIAAAGGQALADELRAKGPEVAGAVAEVVAASDPATLQAAIDAHEHATEHGEAVGQGIADGVASKQDEVDRAMANIWASVMRRPSLSGVGPLASGYVPIPTGASAGGASMGPVAAAATNVRVYIDGDQLRANVRTDVSAASARAALVGTGRSRP